MSLTIGLRVAVIFFGLYLLCDFTMCYNAQYIEYEKYKKILQSTSYLSSFLFPIPEMPEMPHNRLFRYFFSFLLGIAFLPVTTFTFFLNCGLLPPFLFGMWLSA